MADAEGAPGARDAPDGHHAGPRDLLADTAWLRDFIENADVLIHSTDAESRLLYTNRRWRETLGYSAAEASTLTWAAITPPDALPRWQAAFDRAVAGERVDELETVFTAKDGRRVIGVGAIGCRFEGGAPVTTRCIFRDDTALKAEEERLRRQAFYDPLTGLPNRALFMDRLEHALARSTRHEERVVALLLDLDGFKRVNDMLGHEAGDRLLASVGARLAEALRPEDTVARLGGDEFAVLLEEAASSDGAARVAGRITTLFAAPFAIDGVEASVSASVGAALSRAGADADASASDLLREADVAMYQAKRAGKARYAVFDERALAHSRRRQEAEAELRGAVERGELEAHYQPIVTLATGEVAGWEALARWRHPARGLLAPDTFIPLAEETGAIHAIGRWILGEACRQARAWRERHPVGAHPYVSVNLAPAQIGRPDIAQEIAGLLAEAGLDAGGLQVEVTEGALMGDIGQAIATLGALRALGVRVVIDDFGAGYSSLGYLRDLPADGLKIDRTFVRALGRDRRDAAIIQTTVWLARTLGLGVTVEGVETPFQLALVQALRCGAGQGYLFARPQPAAAFEGLLADDAWREELRRRCARPLRREQ